MENIATDLSGREIKRAPLACGKNEWWIRGFFLAAFAFLNTLNSQSFVGICFVGNEWARHMGDIYRAGRAKAGHGSFALLYRVEN